MIKNIIFDYGNTIIRYVPADMVAAFGVTDEEDAEILTRVVFDRKFWDRLDDGTMTQNEFCEDVKAELPSHLQEIGVKICNEWYDNVPFIEGMEELIKKLKKDGYKLYILSNIGEMFAKDRGKLKLYNEYFDGGIISSEEKLIKPNADIFNCLLERYSLKAEECLFVDDLASNIEGAAKCGIKGFRFDLNASALESAIYALRDQYGNFISEGLCFGAALGVIFGIINGNLTSGLAIGMALGVAVGALIKKK